VGYCKGEDLFFRKKEEHTAVMFEKEDRRWWTHLRNEEFEALYNVKHNAHI
jgi:hypothetical protein